MADLPELRALMRLAIRQVLSAYSDPARVQASFEIMGVYSQLVEDGTYFAVECEDRIVGCGGWSRRATLFDGDHPANRDAPLLDPKVEPARLRAMYTHPDYVRRGIGRLVVSLCEAAAVREGFRSLELVAIAQGRSSGYTGSALSPPSTVSGETPHQPDLIVASFAELAAALA